MLSNDILFSLATYWLLTDKLIQLERLLTDSLNVFVKTDVSWFEVHLIID
ncbi:hypothetical protein GARC_1193 [Paraglaciecola arctica BSs20135]|uniref:Uncharacterized protein n=1 Tax=Paraglaciecola arctica BSs20135 TaxID=493475 RepID=K6YNF2_9ALTE|nr:hypothetical protein GARC_1193 [Paraglaciecola arctica BSs20135]